MSDIVVSAPTRSTVGLRVRPKTVAVLANCEVIRYGICGMLEEADGFRLLDLDDSLTLDALTDSRVALADIAIVEYEEKLDADLRKFAEGLRDGGTSFVVLLKSTEEEVLDSAVRVPAHGFLVQADLTREILTTVLHKVANGITHLPGVFADRLLEHARRGLEGTCGHNILTPREQQTLELLVDGLSNKQIARRLGISPHGAKRLVANVLSKLNCPNRTMAVAVALRERLVRRDDRTA